MEFPIVLPLLILPLAWYGLGTVFSFAYPLLRNTLTALPPHARSLFLPVYAWLPLLAATAITLLAFTPAVGGINLSGHCHALDCSAHVPVLLATAPTGYFVSAVLLLLATITVLFVVLSIRRNHCVTGMLARLSERGIDNAYAVLDTPAIIACCVGLLRPQVLISRGLLERADCGQLHVIVAHELAHACRLDNLRKLLAMLAVLGWPQYRREQLLADLELACEQQCDQDVAGMLGSPQPVVETLREVAVWTGDSESHRTCARMVALAGGTPGEFPGWKPAMLILSGSAVLTLIVSDLLHRAAETLLPAVPIIY